MSQSYKRNLVKKIITFKILPQFKDFKIEMNCQRNYIFWLFKTKKCLVLTPWVFFCIVELEVIINYWPYRENGKMLWGFLNDCLTLLKNLFEF